MSHEVESMMYVGQTPWHRLGTKLLAAPTSREAIVAAGLDWNVLTRAVQLNDGTPIVGYKATYRATDGKVFGVVGEGHTPLQNSEAFGFFDKFIAAGEATYDTAGSLADGKRVWILAKIGVAPMRIVGDDTVEQYVLLSNSHDQSLAVSVGYTPVRVVCANTLAMAHRNGESRLIRIKHTKGVKDAVMAVQETMNLARRSFEATAEQYRRLAAKNIVTADLEAYVREVFAPPGAQSRIFDAEFEENPPETAAVVDPRFMLPAPQRKCRLLAPITRLFEEGTGQDLRGAHGTLWGAYNAVTEYIGHTRGTDAAARLDSAWFGQGAQVNSKALAVAIRMAA